MFLLYKQANGKQTFDESDRTPFVKNGCASVRACDHVCVCLCVRAFAFLLCVYCVYL